MIYKTFQKVSNVCQLLDKSKYSATRTINGVTFTNNGDGTITVNGTATARAALTFTSFIKPFLSGKFLLIGCPNGANISKYFNYVFIRTQDGNFINGIEDVGNGGILNYGITAYTVLCQIIVMKDTVCDNLVFKPQLFDLTEMYGSGNEPATVEEFRSKFPNDLYDYKPYCFVKSYKDCLKVSDVCQLMVYPYFETTLTRAGITFTDNGDGTITANGTSVGFATFVFSKNFNFIAGNKYYVSTPYSIIAYKENGTMKYAQGNILFTWKSNWEIVQVYMQINKGITVSNLTFKPQLFDLTEMYGSGNEPTTVEQFRQDFPEEMYDYKPYSTIPSYKKSLVCKTKNLFDINNPKYCCYNIQHKSYYPKIENGIIYFNSWYAHLACNGFAIPIEPNTTFTISFDINEGEFISQIIYCESIGEDGVCVNFGRFTQYKNKNRLTYKQPSTANYVVILLDCMSGPFKCGISNLQLELGSTATEYHPYGYL